MLVSYRQGIGSGERPASSCERTANTSTRISKLLKARLEETGYDDDLKDLAKGTHLSIHEENRLREDRR